MRKTEPAQKYSKRIWTILAAIGIVLGLIVDCIAFSQFILSTNSLLGEVLPFTKELEDFSYVVVGVPVAYCFCTGSLLVVVSISFWLLIKWSNNRPRPGGGPGGTPSAGSGP